jgi:beta-lactamase regulating signal transducer with metallopeptidase domain
MMHSGWLAEFSVAAWPVIAEHLWQSTILAGLCFLVSPAFSKSGARARYALWGLAFIRFAIPPVFSGTTSVEMLPVLGQSIGSSLKQASIGVGRVMHPSMWTVSHSRGANDTPFGHPEIYSLLTIVWISGCVLLLGSWCFRQIGVMRSLQRARYENSGELMHLLDILKDKVGIRRKTRLRVVFQGSDAGVLGIWNPILVFPELMPRHLAPDEVKAVLAHELIHIERKDNLWNNLQMVLCCILWFYPVIWILDRRLTAEREHSCDERVIDLLRNPAAYASSLIKMARIGIGLQFAGGSAMTRSSLKRRIAEVKPSPAKTGLGAQILLVSIATLAVILCFLAGSLRKSIAQTSPINLIVENCGKSPLQIVSAKVEALMPEANAQAAAQIINPQILVQNNSNTPASTYVLEFRKSGSKAMYLTRHPCNLRQNETDFIQKSEPLWTKGEMSSAASTGWSIRLVSITFKNGCQLILYPSEIPRTASIMENKLRNISVTKNVKMSIVAVDNQSG